jgi:tetratricopeptide (TPR) repeat protein
VRAVVVIVIVALAPVTAHADPGAKETAEKGFAAYDRGDYAAAISYFEGAYEVDPTAGLLFNIAQAYRQLGPSGCERALDYYERYRTALDDSGAPIKESLKARIIEMKACVESGSAPADDPDKGEPVVNLEQSAKPATSSRRLVGWLLLGGGGIAIATAAATGALALDRQSDLSSRCTNDVCPPSLEGRVRGYNRLRVATFTAGTVGVVALAVGGYLLYSSNRTEPAVQASVQPVVGYNTVGIRCEF